MASKPNQHDALSEAAANSSDIMPLEELSLLVLCGPSCSGKSHFARRWFRETEVVSLERCAALVSDSPHDKGVREAAVSLLESIVELRLQTGRFTVVDAPCLDADLRKRLVHCARHFQVASFLLLFDTPQALCLQRNQQSKLPIDPFLIKLQYQKAELAKKIAKQEGFRDIFSMSQFPERSPLVLRQPMPIRLDESGPFDMIGDIHGCFRELQLLLDRLGYVQDPVQGWYHPEGRKVVFLGDLADRGPQSVPVINTAMTMFEQGHALYIPGNHCDKLARYLRGSNVLIGHGLETTVAEIERLDTKARKTLSERFLAMFDCTAPYLMLDQDRLVVAHAGLPEEHHGRLSRRIRAFALFGDVTGEVDANGLPIRRDWAKDYRGNPLVVYGHTPTLYPRFVNNSANIDQGCVFGGGLSALRYPERQLVTIPAKYVYWQA
jgi:protein phosphatase